MSLEAIAQIASIIASVAVVLTLIFIALQMRQTLKLTKMGAAQSAALLLSQNYGRVIEHADLAEILASNDEGIDLQGADLLRVTNFLSASFRYYEMLHAHQRAGIFDNDLWAGTEARLHEALDDPRVREWWAGSRRFYAPSFVTMVDKVCAKEADIDRIAETGIATPTED